MEKLLLQRSRHFKPESDSVAEVYEQSIPSANEQLGMFEMAFDTVSRMIAVAQSAATSTRKKSTDSESGYIGLIVDPVTAIVRRTGEKYRDRFLRLRPNSAELHTLVVAINAGAEGASPQEWEKGYPVGLKWSGHRNVKSRLGEKLLDRFDVAFENGEVLRLTEI